MQVFHNVKDITLHDTTYQEALTYPCLPRLFQDANTDKKKPFSEQTTKSVGSKSEKNQKVSYVFRNLWTSIDFVILCLSKEQYLKKDVR